MVLYEFSVSSFITYSLDELVSCLFCLLVSGLILWRKPAFLKEKQTFILILLSVFAFINLITVNSVYQEYSMLKEAYETGTCDYVEGTITDYKGYPDTVQWYEEFKVKDVFCAYSSAETTLSYNKPKTDGGVITGNGQKVRIGYVLDEMSAEQWVNRIVYIEQLV